MTDDSAETPPAEPGLPALPVFNIHINPVVIPAPFANALAHIVVEWSRLEDALWTDLEWMMRFPNVARLTKEPPRAFNRKLELWKRAVDELFRTVASYRERAALVVSRATEAAKLRNHLVHGTWPIDNPTAEGSFLVLNFRGSGDKLQVASLTINQQGLDQLAKEILDVAGLISGLTMTRMLLLHEGLLKARVE
jgi:hypothetical protein